jgi:hypothetical protein
MLRRLAQRIDPVFKDLLINMYYKKIINDYTSHCTSLDLEQT